MYPDFHILVVDDMPTVRWLVTTMLHQLGFSKVTEAGDGEEALQALYSSDAIGMPVNFVITDWQMPVMNGHALLQKIRATAGFKQLPVLVFSSESETEIRNAAIREGIDGYVHKSALRPEVIKEVLEEILIQRGVAE